MQDCLHEQDKVSEVLFNKFGKMTSVLICCLKCGSQIKIHGKNRNRGYEIITNNFIERNDTERFAKSD